MNFKTYVPQCKILNSIHSMALTEWCKFSIDLRALLTWTFWYEQIKRTSKNFSFRVKKNELRGLIWLIELTSLDVPHVTYRGHDFWYVAGVFFYAIALRSVVKKRYLCIYGKRNTCTKSAKKPKDAILRPVFISCLSDLKLPLHAVKFAK